MDDDRRSRISRFFAWYRQRVANIRALGETPPPVTPDPSVATFGVEQHVLIGAGLDSLANHWARAFPPALVSKGSALRMSAFLQANVNSSNLFSRVAAPLLRRAAMKKKRPDWAAAVARAAGHQESFGVVRSAEDDPTYDTLVANPIIQGAGIPSEEIRKQMYGEILYREYRCNWVHEFQRSDEIAPSDWDITVRYQNFTVFDDKAGTTWTKKHRLVFPLRVLLDTYDEAISSFERQCFAESRDPVP